MNKYIASGIVVAIVAYGVYSAGYSSAENVYLEQIVELNNQLKKKQSHIDSLAVDLATSLGKTEIVFRDIETEVIKYVETTPIIECFDDNAIKLWNSAASGQ